MRILNAIQNNFWAIKPEKLEAIQEVLDRRLEAKDIPGPEEVAAAAAKNTRAKAGEFRYLTVQDGVGVLSVEGVLAKRMNLFMAFSGGSSTELLAKEFQAAVIDDKIEAIVLDVDSPGGTVDGTEALANMVYEARGKKPIVAFANGLMASAAYWIGSAADKLYIEETGEAGSIGVISVHYDFSRYDEKVGVKRTIIKAGRYKAAGNDTEPLNREAEDYLQAGVDYVYSLFVNAVARNRNASVNAVLEGMADGRIFIGRQALDAGLVDRIGNLGAAVQAARAMVGGSTIKTIKRTEVRVMDKATLKAEHPDLYNEVLAEGREAGLEAGRTEGAQQGAQQERERVVSILETAGEEIPRDIQVGLVKDGTAADQAYKKFFEAMKEKRKEGLKDLAKEAPEPVNRRGGGEMPSVEAGNLPETREEAGKQLDARAQEIKDEKGCTYKAAMAQARKERPEVNRIYLGRDED